MFLSLRIILCLKALLARVLTIVKNSKLYNWLIKMWNYSNFIWNNLNASIKWLSVSIDRFLK